MIRLSPPRPRTSLPASPFASLAVLLLSLVVLAGLFAAARGPGLRFATAAKAAELTSSPPLVVRILPGGEALLNDAPVAAAGLAAAVREKARGVADPAALLVVSPDATYGEMVAAYGALLSVPNVRVVLPARGWVEVQATP